MTNFEFMEKAQEKVIECWKKLNTANLTIDPPKVDFLLKGRCAGMATDRGTRISLNLAFVAKNAQDMLEQTVPHEVVHCWLTQIADPSHVRNSAFGRRSPHGYTFMNTLASLGCRMERTHGYESDGPPTSRSTFKYVCANCGKVYWITRAKHLKIKNHYATCWCSSCGRGLDEIKYVEK